MPNRASGAEETCFLRICAETPETTEILAYGLKTDDAREVVAAFIGEGVLQWHRERHAQTTAHEEGTAAIARLMVEFTFDGLQGPCAFSEEEVKEKVTISAGLHDGGKRIGEEILSTIDSQKDIGDDRRKWVTQEHCLASEPYYQELMRTARNSDDITWEYVIHTALNHHGIVVTYRDGSTMFLPFSPEEYSSYTKLEASKHGYTHLGSGADMLHALGFDQSREYRIPRHGSKWLSPYTVYDIFSWQYPKDPIIGGLVFPVRRFGKHILCLPEDYEPEEYDRRARKIIVPLQR